MARPIEPTPILEGKDAEILLKEARYNETHHDPKRSKFLKECRELFEKIKIVE